ncbi:MAG: class I SAM-dependent methyltransferase [Candidatus Bathyarchaeia archaeon]
MKDSVALISAPSLIVERGLGQAALRLTKTLKLFDNSLKVASFEGRVVVPLMRRPVESEFEILRLKLERFQVADYVFERVERAPRNLTEALKGKLPQHVIPSLPRSYDLIGDIAVLEIPKELRTYAEAIAETVKKLNPRVKTILMKASPVKDTFRVREYVILEGGPSTVTCHVEYGSIFRLDPLKVFFSPRLSHERQRVASIVREGEIIIDMFAGVGAFSIIIARSKDIKKVYGLDINPEATSFMLQNIILNRLRGRVVAVLADAASDLPLYGLANRVIMNLPERSLEFIGNACRFLTPMGGYIHLYTFITEGTTEESLLEVVRGRILEAGRRVVSTETLRRVKAVAPREWQLVADIKVA